jgi:hypothetical protein
VPADDLQPPGLRQQRLVDPRAAHDQAVGLAQTLDQRLVGRLAGMVERDAGRREEAVDPLGMDRIGDDDMGHGRNSSAGRLDGSVDSVAGPSRNALANSRQGGRDR